MPYAKYQSFRPFGSLQDDFLKSILIIPFGCHGNQISTWNEILWTTLDALHPRINPARLKLD
jgi:hypothetical protein